VGRFLGKLGMTNVPLGKLGMTWCLLLALAVCGCQEEASSGEYEADAKKILHDIINYTAPSTSTGHHSAGNRNIGGSGDYGEDTDTPARLAVDTSAVLHAISSAESIVPDATLVVDMLNDLLKGAGDAEGAEDTEGAGGIGSAGDTEGSGNAGDHNDMGETEDNRDNLDTGEMTKGKETATAAEPSANNPVSSTSVVETSSDDCCVFESSLRETSLPLVIIKTNLLYDVALTPNLGVEVPIGERYSVEVDFMRGWWLKRDWSFCWQLEAASLEGRYWFSDRAERYLKGGWYAGILLQGAFYDFQLNSTRGVQGETMMAGVTGGYLYPLGCGWSLEFSLGLGYLRTNYRRYTVETIHNDEHELVKSDASMRLQGVFPLKAGVSIQWAIRTKSKRRTL
jgi:hypothetical protein